MKRDKKPANHLPVSPVMLKVLRRLYAGYEAHRLSCFNYILFSGTPSRRRRFRDEDVLNIRPMTMYALAHRGLVEYRPISVKAFYTDIQPIRFTITASGRNVVRRAVRSMRSMSR